MPYRSMHIVAASGNTLLQSAPSEISEARVNARSSVGCETIAGADLAEVLHDIS